MRFRNKVGNRMGKYVLQKGHMKGGVALSASYTVIGLR